MLVKEVSFKNDPLVGIEVITSRQHATKMGMEGLENLIEDLSTIKRVNYTSFTDNAGGIPGFAPTPLVRKSLEKGLSPLVHIATKDRNRASLERMLWTLHHEGVRDILALTGDAPITGHNGVARGVYDLDSVSLVDMLKSMNHGVDEPRLKKGSAPLKTEFDIGVVANPFKMNKAELLPQYFKLWKKIKYGGEFVIPQLGYDSRKVDELNRVMKHWDMDVPVFGNVYVLTKGTARYFSRGIVPGLLLSQELMEEVQDKDKSYFLEFAAKQMAIATGLGAYGIHLSGTHNSKDIRTILDTYESFKDDDWKDFAREINYEMPDQFFLFEKDQKTGLNTDELNHKFLEQIKSSPPLSYKVNKAVHSLLFEDGVGHNLMRSVYNWLEGHPKVDNVAHLAERLVKTVMYGCQDCGDCTLPEREYLCVMEDCGKGLRNGPCGGSNDGMCEVIPDKECMYVREYNIRKTQDSTEEMKTQELIIIDGSLKGTSGWKNFFLGKDHTAKE